jgi:hypothetical protein
MSQRLIDSYFLRSSSALSSSSSRSTASIVIDVDSDDSTVDEQAPARKRQRSRATSYLSQQSIESYFDPPATRFCGDDDVWNSDNDHLPLSVLIARSTQSSSQLSSQSSAVVRRAVSDVVANVNGENDDTSVNSSQQSAQSSSLMTQPVVRRAISDITNVSSNNRRAAQWYTLNHDFYRETRDRFAYPADRTQCAHCHVNEHHAIHHEKEFRRTGPGVSSSALISALTPIAATSSISSKIF